MVQRQTLSVKVFLATCVCTLLVVTAACGGFGLWSTVPCTEGWLGMTVEVPPAAEIIREQCVSAFNPTYTLIAEIAPDQLEAFQAATPVSDWTVDPLVIAAWDVEADRAVSAIGGRFSNGAIYVEALIDTSDSERYVVYYKATYVD